MSLLAKGMTTALFILISITTTLKAQVYKASGKDSSANNNSQLISYDIPEILKPGEEYVVTIKMVNIGKDKWKRSEGYQLALYDQADNIYQADVWGVKYALLPYDVNPNEKVTFLFKITAPEDTGIYNFRWIMSKGNEFFGEYTSGFVRVGNKINRDGNSSQFVSLTVPEKMTAGEKYKVTILMKNTGVHPWYSAAGSDYKIAPLTDSNSALISDWNSSPNYLINTVDTGETSAIEFEITAPNIPGTYSLQWMMKKGESFFGQPTKKVYVTVSKNSKSTKDPRANNSAFVDQNIPVYMTEGVDNNVSVTMSNTGSKTWIKGSEQLVMIDNDNTVTTLNAWGVGYIQLPENVEPGKTVTFKFKVRPRALGWQYFRMIMMNKDGTIFGEPTQSVEIIISKK